MANNVTGNPIYLDTAGPALASTTIVRIAKLKWASVTTAGQFARLEHALDATGTNVFWQSTSASAYHNEGDDWSTHNKGWSNTMQGIRVASISSGYLLIWRE
jgi:hypothetical protein